MGGACHGHICNPGEPSKHASSNISGFGLLTNLRPVRRTDLVHLPVRDRAPLIAIARRIGLAAGLVLFVAAVVLVERDGYVDVTGDSIGLIDAIYYASVTVTTTGYGDITAISDAARLATILLITPARILFLILVVSTTVEVLTEQSRELLAQRRWRQSVNNHTVICGFGATGQAAAADLLTRGVLVEDIVVVDKTKTAIADASRLGYVGVLGDATHNDVLEQASVRTADAVIVAPNRDDTAVLVTLSVREMNTHAHVVAAGRQQENLHLLRQGGANEVIDATAAVGRMLGLGTHAPGAVQVLDDLLDAGQGLELVAIIAEAEGGGVPAGATLIAIIRDGVRLSVAETAPSNVRPTDRIVILRDS